MAFRESPEQSGQGNSAPPNEAAGSPDRQPAPDQNELKQDNYTRPYLPEHSHSAPDPGSSPSAGATPPGADPRGRRIDIDQIPAPLKELPHWVCWKSVPEPGAPKSRKIPIDPKTGKEAKSNDPSTWGTFDQALAYWDKHPEIAGIGFVFSANDPFFGVDLDHCIDPATGELLPVVLEVDKKTGEVKRTLDPAEIIRDLDTYTEVSPSSTGLHGIGKGKLPPGGRKKGAFEWYDRGRYFTVTGRRWPGTPATVKQRTREDLYALYGKVWPKDSKPKGNGEAKSARQAGPELSLSDQELIDRACQAKNGAAFAALWRGDTSGYGSASEADLAACSLLAFWTNGQAGAIDRLFRRSGLMRDKWSERRGEQTYGERTIAKALEGFSEGYTGKGKGNSQRQNSHQASPGAAGDGDQPQQDPGDDWPRLIPEDRALFDYTDLANAWRLAYHLGKSLLFVERIGWHIWKQSHWVRSDQAVDCLAGRHLSRLIHAEAAETSQEAAACKDADRRKALADKAERLSKWAARSEARDKVAAAVAMAAPKLFIQVHELDTDPWLLNCLNGALDLRSGELRCHRRADFSTKAVALDYDPAALYPTWQAFLARIFAGNAALIDFIQRAAGYSLTGKTGEQCVFILHGAGQNGKTTFLGILLTLLGPYGQQATQDLLVVRRGEHHATEIAELRGARLITAIETGEGQRLNEPLVKQMSGGDKLRGRFMRQDAFEFMPEFKLWLATNHKPVIRGTDLAIWRRIRLIPFDITIPKEERDTSLPAKLKAELPGILTWAVQGCLAWQREGLKPPAAVINATASYQAEMDVLAAFLAECCITGPNCKATAADLYGAYTRWCDANGERAENQRSFGMRLTERGFDRFKVRGAARWRGLGIQVDEVDDVDDGRPGNGYEQPNKDLHGDNPRSRSTSSTSSTKADDSEVW